MSSNQNPQEVTVVLKRPLLRAQVVRPFGGDRSKAKFTTAVAGPQDIPHGEYKGLVEDVVDVPAGGITTWLLIQQDGQNWVGVRKEEAANSFAYYGNGLYVFA